MKKKALVTLLTVGVVAAIVAVIVPTMRKDTNEPVTVVDDVDDKEPEDSGGKKVVLNDTKKDDYEFDVIQNTEPAEQTTQAGQAYDDFLEEEDAEKLEPEEEFTIVPFQTTFYVSSDTSVFEKPDNTSTALGSVKYGDEILTNGKVNEVDWYRFVLDNKDVFISASFLSTEKLELEEEVVESDYPSQEEIIKALKEKAKDSPYRVEGDGGVPTSQTGSGSGENWDEQHKDFVSQWGDNVIIY